MNVNMWVAFMIAQFDTEKKKFSIKVVQYYFSSICSHEQQYMTVIQN